MSWLSSDIQRPKANNTHTFSTTASSSAPSPAPTPDQLLLQLLLIMLSFSPRSFFYLCPCPAKVSVLHPLLHLFIVLTLLQKMEREILDHRIVDKDVVSTLLAAKAIHVPKPIHARLVCKWSERFDGYVSTFRFLGNAILSAVTSTTTRSMMIL